MQVSPRISGEKPGHSRFPSFLLFVGPREAPENSPSTKYSMYWYLPTVFLLLHVRFRNSRLDASVVGKLSMALAHTGWGVTTGVRRTWMGLIEIEFRLSSHEFSI